MSRAPGLSHCLGLSFLICKRGSRSAYSRGSLCHLDGCPDSWALETPRTQPVETELRARESFSSPPSAGGSALTLSLSGPPHSSPKATGILLRPVFLEAHSSLGPNSAFSQIVHTAVFVHSLLLLPVPSHVLSPSVKGLYCLRQFSPKMTLSSRSCPSFCVHALPLCAFVTSSAWTTHVKDTPTSFVSPSAPLLGWGEGCPLGCGFTGNSDRGPGVQRGHLKSTQFLRAIFRWAQFYACVSK